MTAVGNDFSLFNSGIMVLEPSNCTFQIFMDHRDDIVSYNGSDQGFLNELFVWWHRLPRRVNFLKNFWSNSSENEIGFKNELSIRRLTNNTELISPVGNRVSVIDLIKSQTLTLPVQSSSNICRIAASPDGVFLLTVDENRRCLFINLRRRVVLHRISFKHPVNAVKFSPNGAYIVVATGKLLQIWRSPGFKKEFFPFELVKTFADCDDKVTALDWSPDSSYLLAGSKDLTARLFCMEKLKSSQVRDKPFMFLGHRDTVMGVFFGVDKKTNKVCKVYTITRDCYMFSWGFKANEAEFDEMEVEASEPPSPGTPDRESEGNLEGDDTNDLKKREDCDGKSCNVGEESGYLQQGKWELLRKDNFSQAPSKLTACDYHRGLDMVVVGFSNGVFGRLEA